VLIKADFLPYIERQEYPLQGVALRALLARTQQTYSCKAEVVE
jgi:hypothetical protein